MAGKGIIYVLKGLFIGSMNLLLVHSAGAQLIRVESLLSRDSLMIGEQIVYTLKVEAAKDVAFSLPALKDTISSTLEVISPLGADTISAGERIVVEQHYLITGFESGPQLVPSQEVIYHWENEPDTARSMPLVVHLYDPPVDTAQQIKPIKAPINTPLSFKEVLPWAAAGLGGLLLVGWGIWFLRRYLKRRKDPETFIQKPAEPAHVIAFRELDKLKEEKIWARGEVKQYYTRLTDITRQYIERQYGIPAMESTTDEILFAFRKANPEDTLLDEILQELLQLADLVKFAREDPLPVENQTNLNNAYIFVQKTFPLFYHSEQKKETEYG
jgi:hypothetical protein